MKDLFFEPVKGGKKPYLESLRKLLQHLRPPFSAGDTVGIKLHWGEKGNKGFLPPDYARKLLPG